MANLHPVNKYLSSNYYSPDVILDAKNIAMNKTDRSHAS